ncbi:hydrogen peroxide-inducible genes activator [Paracoccus aerodenitrificans]|uniref:hydrogen peroxide-inducible genes activator n=1 Tax=Paracoccus aerodenitrificans TaxID=3017781 RepID=UPI0022F082EC|nr:hydrogen peroxide-inducible genes activator [Paracoccus aerodenitrificans]WBU63984.1 LysR substrate-binding domain-containing protein [Paracoccus aerodenitrificans]
MQSLTLKQLRYFEALARTGQFGRAADDCAITQPALSMQIKELEALLGAPLVERSARRVRLTALGQQFAIRAREILRSVDELGDLVRADGENLSGPLRIGVIPTVAPYLLPRLMQALGRQFPRLEPQPRETVTARLIEDLLESRLDVAIVALPVSEPSLHEEPLFDEEFVLVRPIADAQMPVPSAENLQEMQLLLLEEGHCFRDQALSFCNLPQPPRGLMEGSSLSTLVQMVGAGIGVTLIPEMAVAVETRTEGIQVVRLAEPRPTRTIGMIWRKSSPLAQRFAQIAQIVSEIGRSLDARI